jgi:alpha/beta superfamily hydrolase
MVGNIPQLGNWKEFKATMKWTQGHFWVIENLQIPKSTQFFEYKYVVLRDGVAERWEEGFNRIADL